MDHYGYNSYEIDHYGYNSYESNTGEYHSTPYNYDVVPFESNFNYSSYHEPELIEYYPSINPCNNFYDSSQLAINYSTYSLSNSKVGYNISSETQYLISYSTSEFNAPASEFNEPAYEFNEPAFVEYDPTPYDGGYDIGTTYGKPLPPSDDICYPRTTPTSNESLDNFSYASIPSPYGKEGRANDSPEKQITIAEPIDSPEKQITIAEPIEVSEGGSGSDSEIEDEDVAVVGLVGPIDDSNQGEITGGYTYPHYEYGYPWSCYDNGYGNGKSGWYEEGCEKGVDQTTYGYGSDTIELCESLFGYWPCLSKKPARKDKYNHNQGFGSEVGRCSSKPWEQTADYLFGYDGRYNPSCSHVDQSHY